MLSLEQFLNAATKYSVCAQPAERLLPAPPNPTKRATQTPAERCRVGGAVSKTVEPSRVPGVEPCLSATIPLISLIFTCLTQAGGFWGIMASRHSLTTFCPATMPTMPSRHGISKRRTQVQFAKCRSPQVDGARL